MHSIKVIDLAGVPAATPSTFKKNIALKGVLGFITTMRHDMSYITGTDFEN